MTPNGAIWIAGIACIVAFVVALFFLPPKGGRKDKNTPHHA